MDKRMIFNLVIGVGLAVVAVILINGHMQRRERLIQELMSRGEIVEVVVSTMDIPRETTITEKMVALKQTRTASYRPGDLTSIRSAIGKFTVVEILKDQHVSRNMLRTLGSIKYLSQGIPKGMRAITIPVDRISAIEGLIKPGDFIDMIGTFNIPTGQKGQNLAVVVTLFQGIKILATGTNLSPFKAAGAADTVTIALKPEDVKLLTYVLDTGNKIRLVLRAPLDSSEEVGYRGVTFETLMKRLGMWTSPSKVQQRDSIEIYTGAQKQELTIP